MREKKHTISTPLNEKIFSSLLQLFNSASPNQRSNKNLPQWKKESDELTVSSLSLQEYSESERRQMEANFQLLEGLPEEFNKNMNLV